MADVSSLTFSHVVAAMEALVKNTQSPKTKALLKVLSIILLFAGAVGNLCKDAFQVFICKFVTMLSLCAHIYGCA